LNLEVAQLTEKFTYAKAGVNRKLRAESKKALKILGETYKYSHYGDVVQLPYGNIFPAGEGNYLDFVIEGVGTKVLIAQLAQKYDTIGIDAVALAVNDVIRSGARPLAIADNIHAQVSDPDLVEELLKGISKGATESQCVVPSGEIGDVAEVIKGVVEGKGFDLVVATIGEVIRERIIHGTNISPGDVVIGLRSSGIHSNGISLARKVLLKNWGGMYKPLDVPDGLDREVVLEALEPMKIYVEPLLKVADELKIKAAVHITGDAYLKFGNLTRFSKKIGFDFDNFTPQPIFTLIQRTASKLGSPIRDEEMFKTFNMGWGFAIVVDEQDRDTAIDALESAGAEAEQIGHVTRAEGIRIMNEGKRIILKA
jgi:phosphoribosylformylglycinamidine cyclo-ligase